MSLFLAHPCTRTAQSRNCCETVIYCIWICLDISQVIQWWETSSPICLSILSRFRSSQISQMMECHAKHSQSDWILVQHAQMHPKILQQMTFNEFVTSVSRNPSFVLLILFFRLMTSFQVTQRFYFSPPKMEGHPQALDWGGTRFGSPQHGSKNDGNTDFFGTSDGKGDKPFQWNNSTDFLLKSARKCLKI